MDTKEFIKLRDFLPLTTLGELKLVDTKTGFERRVVVTTLILISGGDQIYAFASLGGKLTAESIESLKPPDFLEDESANEVRMKDGLTIHNGNTEGYGGHTFIHRSPKGEFFWGWNHKTGGKFKGRENKYKFFAKE